MFLLLYFLKKPVCPSITPVSPLITQQFRDEYNIVPRSCPMVKFYDSYYTHNKTNSDGAIKSESLPDARKKNHFSIDTNHPESIMMVACLEMVNFLFSFIFLRKHEV